MFYLCIGNLFLYFNLKCTFESFLANDILFLILNINDLTKLDYTIITYRQMTII